MIHGLSIILDDIFKPVFQKIYSIFNINTQCFSFRLFQIIIAFLIIVFMLLKYMKTRVGLKPEEYSKEEIKYDKMKQMA